MVKTGYISFVTETGGGQDVDGNTISTVKTSSAFIDCNLKVVTKKYETFIDGQYKQASYSIIIDLIKFNVLDPAVVLTDISMVDLRDNNNNSLDRFQIHRIDYMNLTKKIKIVV